MLYVYCNIKLEHRILSFYKLCQVIFIIKWLFMVSASICPVRSYWILFMRRNVVCHIVHSDSWDCFPRNKIHSYCLFHIFDEQRCWKFSYFGYYREKISWWRLQNRSLHILARFYSYFWHFILCRLFAFDEETQRREKNKIKLCTKIKWSVKFYAGMNINECVWISFLSKTICDIPIRICHSCCSL